MKLINFYESPIECHIDNVNILCYEPNTCYNETFEYNNKCDKQEIKNIRKSIPNNKPINKKLIIVITIIVCGILLFASVFIYFYKHKPINDDFYSNYSNTTTTNDDDDKLPEYIVPVNSYQNNSNNYAGSSLTISNDDDDMRLPSYEEAIDITNTHY